MNDIYVAILGTSQVECAARKKYTIPQFLPVFISLAIRSLEWMDEVILSQLIRD